MSLLVISKEGETKKVEMDAETTVGFIGGGNMASAIIGGLLKAGVKAQNIIVSDPYEPTRSKVKTDYNVNVTKDNKQVCNLSQVVILAVKPASQVMKDVCNGIAECMGDKLVISIAAGITLKDLSRWLQHSGSAPSIVRVMPNTPALVGQGATGMYAPENVTQQQRDLAINLLGSVSAKSYWVGEEILLDVVTGVSGSGPAYFFLMVECLEKAAIELGLPAEVARGLAAQTCLGAGQMLVDGSPAEELRRKVTSPNGTTEAGIKSLNDSGIHEAIMKAVKAATARSAELGDVLGKQGNNKL